MFSGTTQNLASSSISVAMKGKSFAGDSIYLGGKPFKLSFETAITKLLRMKPISAKESTSFIIALTKWAFQK